MFCPLYPLSVISSCTRTPVICPIVLRGQLSSGGFPDYTLCNRHLQSPAPPASRLGETNLQQKQVKHPIHIDLSSSAIRPLLQTQYISALSQTLFWSLWVKIIKKGFNQIISLRTEHIKANIRILCDRRFVFLNHSKEVFKSPFWGAVYFMNTLYALC